MSLFWKIFASFGIAMTVTLIAAVFVSFRLAENAFDESQFTNRRELIAAASESLASGGRVGLEEWLRRRPRSSGTLLLVFDDEGEELLGREAPRRFVERALGESRNAPGSPRNFRPRRLLPRLVGPDGSNYHLLLTRRPPSLFGVLDWPSTQLSVLAIALTVAALTALLLARYLAKPIEMLQHASRALAEGNLAARVGDTSRHRRDEVGALAKDFDAMAERVQNLVTARETLLRDVSHELRSPLARIRVALALAEREPDGASKGHLKRIEIETERLDELIGQVLLLTRLRSDSTQRYERLSLGDVVEDIVDNARFEYPNRQIDWSFDKDVALDGDREQIASAIENVVRNALLHSGDGSRIDVKLYRRNGFACVAIADEGPGVPDHDLERIFDPFYRADDSRDHQHVGEGIGLAITASVMERHGGKAAAANLTDGGLEITLSFPVDSSG